MQFIRAKLAERLSIADFLVFAERDYQLLKILADGTFHSGSSLGESLGISRAAIWQHIQGLTRYGIAVDAVAGRGYRLQKPLELLDRDAILTSLASTPLPESFADLHILPVTDSTNTFLRDLPSQRVNGITVCLAEYQSSGRGRMGRVWQSPFAANIYLSLVTHLAGGTAGLSGISLAAGIAVAKVINRLAKVDVGLKWPNDILIGDAKLAGILVEAIGEIHGTSKVIIGVGLNVDMPMQAASLIDQRWTDLKRVGVVAGRNEIVTALIQDLTLMLGKFREKGFGGFAEEWAFFDICIDRQIELRDHDRVITGIARGVDSMGMLLVEQAGKLCHYASGELSLRFSH